MLPFYVLCITALFMHRNRSFMAKIGNGTPNAQKALIDMDDTAKEKLKILKYNIENRFVSRKFCNLNL